MFMSGYFLQKGETVDIRKEFIAKYETLWDTGAWSGRKSRDHAAEWYKLTDNLESEELGPIFELALAKKPEGKAPSLHTFWGLYKQVKGRPIENRDKGDCKVCENRGLINVPAVRIDGRWKFGVITYGPLAMINFPCPCGHGEVFRKDRESMPVDTEAHDYLQKCQAQISFLDMPMSQRRDWASFVGSADEARRRAKGKHYSVQQLFTALVRDSIAIHKEGLL